MIVIKQWFDIIAVNIESARAFEKIMYLFFNSLDCPTMLASYTFKKNS